MGYWGRGRFQSSYLGTLPLGGMCPSEGDFTLSKIHVNSNKCSDQSADESAFTSSIRLLQLSCMPECTMVTDLKMHIANFKNWLSTYAEKASKWKKERKERLAWYRERTESFRYLRILFYPVDKFWNT